MGGNRVNQNLTIKQEYYARSGRTGQEINSNAEGYTNSIPAMNVPGRKLLVGYEDPNLHIVPRATQL